jgi:hypothetical protein
VTRGTDVAVRSAAVKRITVLLVLVALGTCGLVATPASAATTNTVWLCRPGATPDPCTASRAATRVAADGTKSVERPAKPGARTIDCFYVYPTVSLQPGVNATLAIEPNEIGVARSQASRYSQVCNVWAPMYRQLTLSALGGRVTPQAVAVAYGDVRDAWRDYLAHHNHGRGVVLIGHSQGAGMLVQLLQKEIDTKPAVRKRLVAAYLMGGNVTVPKGRDVGGDFQHVPACRKRTQTGCVVAFSTFDQTPPADALFGRANTSFSRVRPQSPADTEILCVNPAALQGGAAPLRAYFPAHTDLGVLTSSFAAGSLPSVPTPWITFPGLYRGECRNEDGAQWLQVDEVRTGADTRPALVNSLGPSWGLHLVDANVAVGDEVALVTTQARAWSAKH